MFISVNTGADAEIAGTKAITGDDLGVRYSGFRDLDRFDAQIDGMNVGMISWPGGALAEAQADQYGLNFHDLVSAESGRVGLTEMMKFAVDHGAGLSVVLPTARYANDIDTMRADVQNFMHDLLDGTYGPMPEKMIFHIGSEHYAHFRGLTADSPAEAYGHVASAMVEEIQSALDDAHTNPHHVDIDVSVQAGRTMADDEAIRDSFDPETLKTVDLVMHHRYATQVGGVDWGLKSFGPILDAWQQDVVAAGGEAPETHLSEWNVASLTRNEVLNKYIRDMGQEGVSIHRDDVDLEGRTDTQFENYWQDAMATRDYGVAAPRLYLELFSEYQAEGLGSATIHAVDMVHAGRITFEDVNGEPVRFVGGEMINMLYESVEGTKVLDAVEENDRHDEVWTYGFESDDRTVVFLASDPDKAADKVDLQVEGLDKGYAAIWVEGLTAEVPDDWMQRFDIPDNANVDESNEGQTYAIGHREHLPFDLKGDVVSLSMDHPGEVVRIVIAHTPEEAAQIAGWAGEPDGILNNGVETDPSLHADDHVDPVDTVPAHPETTGSHAPGNLHDLLTHLVGSHEFPSSPWMQDLIDGATDHSTGAIAKPEHATVQPDQVVADDDGRVLMISYSQDQTTDTAAADETGVDETAQDADHQTKPDLEWLAGITTAPAEESQDDDMATDDASEDAPSSFHAELSMMASAAASVAMGTVMMALTQAAF